MAFSAIIMGFMRIPRLSLLGTLMTALLYPLQAFMQVPIPMVPAQLDPCSVNLAPGLPCASGGGAAGANAFVISVLVPRLEEVFLAIAILFFFYYAVRLMLESEDENTITETKNAYAYAVAGAVFVSIASLIVQAVGPGYATTSIINTAPVVSALSTVTFYFRLLVSTAVTGLIVYQGIRIILLQGQESEMEQQKKRFFHGLIGVAIVLLANVIIEGFVPIGGVGPFGLAIQIVGIINFLLEILGALSVLGFIVGGVMIVVSTDEALKDRGKKAIFTTIITLILVLCSYVIVNFVAFL